MTSSPASRRRVASIWIRHAPAPLPEMRSTNGENCTPNAPQNLRRTRKRAKRTLKTRARAAMLILFVLKEEVPGEMSLRSEAVRLGLRWLIKHRNCLELSIQQHRQFAS